MRRRPPADAIDADRRIHAKTFAKSLRKQHTLAEAYLWEHIRNRQLGGFKFRDQQAVEGRIIDFYCAEARLGIEVDGSSHDDRTEDDEQKARMIEAQGIKLIRFTNEEVLNRIERVVERIRKEIEDRPRFRY